jgi:hypothetical protein
VPGSPPRRHEPIVSSRSRGDHLARAFDGTATNQRRANLSPDQIDDRLKDRFRILTHASRTAPPRQQTLRATLDWSFGLLSERERILFRRLAVFAGGWTLEAAEATCTGDGIAGDDVFDLLAGLVDKCFVVADHAGESVRYRLFETTREYGWEKLRLTGEEVTVRDGHRNWLVALAEEADEKIRGFAQATWLTRLEREHDNIRATLAWCLQGKRHPEAALRVAGALAWFCRLRGHIGEGRRWLDLALAGADRVVESTRSHALNGAAFLAFAESDVEAATELFGKSLRLARAMDDWSSVAWALHGLGRVEEQLSNYDHASNLLDESLTYFRNIPIPSNVSADWCWREMPLVSHGSTNCWPRAG